MVFLLPICWVLWIVVYWACAHRVLYVCKNDGRKREEGGSREGRKGEWGKYRYLLGSVHIECKISVILILVIKNRAHWANEFLSVKPVNQKQISTRQWLCQHLNYFPASRITSNKCLWLRSPHPPKRKKPYWKIYIRIFQNDVKIKQKAYYSIKKFSWTFKTTHMYAFQIF